MAYLTDMEKRLLFSSLTREKKLCEEIDNDKADDDVGGMLVPIVDSLESKFKYDKFEKQIYNKAIDDCIKILDTKGQKYHDVLNDRYDMIEYLRELKAE